MTYTDNILMFHAASQSSVKWMRSHFSPPSLLRCDIMSVGQRELPSLFNSYMYNELPPEESRPGNKLNPANINLAQEQVAAVVFY